MIDAECFRQYARTCMQLSHASVNEKVASKLVSMAEDFMARADELDNETKPFPLKPQSKF